MENTELAQAILDYIAILYSATYEGYIRVLVEDDLYTLELGIPSYLCKSTISGQFDTDEDFLDYIYEELRIRNYVRIYFYKTIRQHEIIEE